MQQHENTKLLNSFYYPALFVALIWVIKILELAFDTSFSSFGIMPQKASGLIGIITAPLLHGDLAHLTANSLPAMVLGAVLLYVYRPIAWKVFILTYLVTGFWVWVFGRQNYHIGASGVIYGLASFLFFSGVFRRDNRLLAVTLLVAFLYGSMVWGIFPELFPEKNISWESHLMGLLAGFIFALYFKGEGPVRKRYSWEVEEEDDTDENDPEAYWNVKPKQKKETVGTPSKQTISPQQINYIYKESNVKKDDTDQSQKINF